MPKATTPFSRAVAQLERAERSLNEAREILLSQGRPDSNTTPTKADRIMARLHAKRGADLQDLADRMGVLPKTIRSVISRESRRRGVQVTREGTRYFAH